MNVEVAIYQFGAYMTLLIKPIRMNDVQVQDYYFN